MGLGEGLLYEIGRRLYSRLGEGYMLLGAVDMRI